MHETMDVMRTGWGVLMLVGCGSSTPAVDAMKPSDAMLDAPPDACLLGAWGAPRLIAELSTAQHEASPWISEDRLEIAYQWGTRIYLATRGSPSAPFDTPVVVDTSVIGPQGTPTLTPDGRDLYFTATPAFSSGDPYAYTARRTARGQPFTGTHYIGFGIHGLDRAPDGNEFFIDSRNSLGLEMLVTTLMPNGFFAPAERLSTPPNTDGDECCGQLTPEGLIYSGTLAGVRTLLVSTRMSYAVFKAPQEYAAALAPPAGSENHDFHLTGDGRTIVFASNRPGGAGGFDLYMAERPCQ